MKKQPTYWVGLEDMNPTPEYLAEAGKEFPTDLPVEDMLSGVTDESLSTNTNRRDFMKVMGFGITAATLAACAEGPMKKAIPYVVKPDDVVPGVANWYSSTAANGLPVIVKTREGRPIKLEGNPDSSYGKGGLDAVTQASLLSLYDTTRARRPQKGANNADWGDVDAEIINQLQAIQANGGQVRVLSRTVLSPSTKQIISDFLGQFGENGQHVMYDPVSSYAIAKAHGMDFGIAPSIPHYRLDEARVIVGVNCDFLGTWMSPVAQSAQYATRRDPNGEWMSRHFQIESAMSITGSKADLRLPVDPSKEGLALLNLYNKVARRMGAGELQRVPAFDLAASMLDKIADELTRNENRGNSLIISGSNDLAVQHVVNGLNVLLGNYGNTLDLTNPSHLKQGNDEDLATLVEELSNGQVAALFLYDANPVYDSPHGSAIAEAIKGVSLSVSLSGKPNESSADCQYLCPDSHFLESWGDAQQHALAYSLMQPTIHPIFDTRQAQDSFLKWSGANENYYTYLQRHWRENILGTATAPGSQSDWDQVLQKGVLEMSATEGAGLPAFSGENLPAASQALQAQAGNASEMEVIFHESVALRNGEYTNNPWLQELSDPVTRATWDHYLTVPYQFAEDNNLKNEDVVEFRMPGSQSSIQMPIIVQPGQAMNTLAIHVGYGRGAVAGKVAEMVGGVNVYPLMRMQDGLVQYSLSGVSTPVATGETYPLAFVQTHSYLYDQRLGNFFGNDFDRTEAIIKETVLDYYNSPEDADNPYREELKKYEEKKSHLISLWDSYFEDPESKRNIHWAMAVDLNKCTGCGACVVACQAENNIPVVGKEEVRRRRAMYWMRIDRYYSGDPNNPDTVFQPMMCQHCDNAPCETVCPVLATIHSNEGLNQMTYNRCVGTRYCANNCPYKVRRFNWFNYVNGGQFKDVNPGHETNKLGYLALNPDVTVRFRGVMEKCSFCVQRLQEAKLRAKVNAESTYAKPEANDKSLTACMQSCPTGAIVFGDRNDPNSEISKLWRDDNERKYLALEEVKTLSSVAYLTLVRNRTAEEYAEKKAAKEEEQSYS